MAQFNRVTIIGLGLIGGSLGLALKKKRIAKEVIGVSRHAPTIREAVRRKAVDSGAVNPIAGVRASEIVVLATPVDLIVPTAKRVAGVLRPGTVLTDVGSSKTEIVRALEKGLPRHVAFVGGHPLAGSDQRGLDAANEKLFNGSTCVLTRTGRTSLKALEKVKRLWQPLVKKIEVTTPQRHDVLVASASHLPHLLAFALAGATPDEAAKLGLKSFKDVTRIARSEPELWDDIFLSNREAVLGAIDRFERQWKSMRGLIQRSNASGLKQQLARARRRRESID